MTSAREQAIAVMASAMYEEPYTYCETCKGIGQDENRHFWCSACNGEGYIVDQDEVGSHREYAELLAISALDALLAAMQEQTCPTCGGRACVQIIHGENDIEDVPCPDCSDGVVPGTEPLVLLGPERVACFRSLDETDADNPMVHWGWIDSPIPWTPLFADRRAGSPDA